MAPDALGPWQYYIRLALFVLPWVFILLITQTRIPNESATNRLCGTSTRVTALSDVFPICQSRLLNAFDNERASLFSCVKKCHIRHDGNGCPHYDAFLELDLEAKLCRIALNRVLHLSISPLFEQCEVLESKTARILEALVTLSVPSPTHTDCVTDWSPRRLQFMGIDQLKGSRGSSNNVFGAMGEEWEMDFNELRAERWKREEDLKILSDSFTGEEDLYGASQAAVLNRLTEILGQQVIDDDALARKDLYPQTEDEITRYNSHLLDFLPDVYNKVIWNNYATDYHRNLVRREAQVRVGNDKAFGGGGIGLLNEMTQFNMGCRTTFISTSTNQRQKQLGVTVLHQDHGVSIARSHTARASVVEALARGVRSSTLADFSDRNYGQRIKVRDIDIMVRHDFDDRIAPNPYRASTASFIVARDFSMAVQSDLTDRVAGVGVAYRTVQASAIANLSNGWISAEASVGKGWHGQLTIDVPDSYNDKVFMRAGFGVLGRSYVGAGAGITGQGLPQFSAEAQLRNVVYGVDWLEDHVYTDRIIAHQTMSVGRFTYIWESHVFADEIPSANEVLANKFKGIGSLVEALRSEDESLLDLLF